MRPHWSLALSLSAVVFAGCEKTATNGVASAPSAPVRSAPTNAAPEEPHYHLDHAQPKGPTSKLWVGAAEVQAEVCTTLQQVATGLMFRDGIGPDDAMLFVFGGTDRRSFYMKNVSFDIAAAYIDAEGVVKEIVQLKKQEVAPVPSRSEDIQFVLETAPDWFTRNGVGPGTLIRTEGGSLREVFARRAILR